MGDHSLVAGGHTFSEAFVPLIPRPMILPLCTNTQPTGVSSDDKASSAISMALRMKPSWYSRLGMGPKTILFYFSLWRLTGKRCDDS